jgi:hypothetical protein
LQWYDSVYPLLHALLTLLFVKLLTICLAWRSPKVALHWWAIHNAVTLALLFVSIYAMLQATR